MKVNLLMDRLIGANPTTLSGKQASKVRIPVFPMFAAIVMQSVPLGQSRSATNIVEMTSASSSPLSPATQSGGITSGVGRHPIGTPRARHPAGRRLSAPPFSRAQRRWRPLHHLSAFAQEPSRFARNVKNRGIIFPLFAASNDTVASSASEFYPKRARVDYP